jgi:hypothetical protein
MAANRHGSLSLTAVYLMPPGIAHGVCSGTALWTGAPTGVADADANISGLIVWHISRWNFRQGAVAEYLRHKKVTSILPGDIVQKI